MPLRMLRDWTDSEAVNSVSWQAEVLFVRLIMKADDFGRYPANPKLLRSLLFPLRDGFRESDISSWLNEIETAGLIATYQAEGKPLLEIVKFDQRMRTKKGKWPEPDGGLRTDDGGLRTDDGLNRIEGNTNTNTNGKGREYAPAPPQSSFYNPISNPPTIRQIREYANSIGLPWDDAEAEKFFNHYSSIGWVLKSGLIQNWTFKIKSWDEQGKRIEQAKGKDKGEYVEPKPLPAAWRNKKNG